MARCSFMFEFSDIALMLIIIVGSSTAFAAATIGLFQNDIKKVIAYSTCSQLGYMVFACGLSSYEVGLFHLSNHAFFKALLFLGAGSIIHAVNDEQDMRKLGGLQRLLPFSYSMMFIGSAALIGFPFLTGFYSKDVILELAYSKYTVVGHYAYFLGSFAVFCTAFYSMRLLILTFLHKPNGNKIIIMNAHEPSWKMALPLCLLCILSVNIGFLTKDLFIGFGTNFWGLSIFILTNNYLLVDSEFVPIFYKLFPLICTLIGCFSAFFIYCFKLRIFLDIKLNNEYINKIIVSLSRKWFFDRIFSEFMTQNILKTAYFFSYKNVDRGLIEQFGPLRIVTFFQKVSNDLIVFQNGSIFHYIIILIFSMYLIFLFNF